MSKPESTLIPLFPLALLPLPGELVPLHIFEPRYKQLLDEAEAYDISFGIYCNHEINTEKLGSLVKLESIIKRYPNGESDIIVKCLDVFTMQILHRTFKNKMYPGGDVFLWDLKMIELPEEHLYETFLEYMALRNITHTESSISVFQIANELNLDLRDRYSFLTARDDKRQAFLLNRLRLLTHVLNQEIKSRNVYHLN